MTDLRKAAEMALEALNIQTPLDHREFELRNSAIEALRQALAQPEQEFVGACVTCGAPKSEWLVDAVNISQERVDETAKREHAPVGWMYVNKDGECEQMEYGPIPFWDDAITLLYTAPPLSDYHEGWEEGFKAAKREWVGLTDAQVEEIAEYHGIDGLYETSRIDFYRAIEITLKEKNRG